MNDPDLNDLLDEALRQARLRKPDHRTKDESHLDYAKRLAEKGLYRRLGREANAQMDALRFEWWFSGEGSEDLTLDQWRILIDLKIEKARSRNEISNQVLSESPSPAEANPTLAGE